MSQRSSGARGCKAKNREDGVKMTVDIWKVSRLGWGRRESADGRTRSGNEAWTEWAASARDLDGSIVQVKRCASPDEARDAVLALLSPAGRVRAQEYLDELARAQAAAQVAEDRAKEERRRHDDFEAQIKAFRRSIEPPGGAPTRGFVTPCGRRARSSLGNPGKRWCLAYVVGAERCVRRGGEHWIELSPEQFELALRLDRAECGQQWLLSRLAQGQSVESILALGQGHRSEWTLSEEAD